MSDLRNRKVKDSIDDFSTDKLSIDNESSENQAPNGQLSQMNESIEPSKPYKAKPLHFRITLSLTIILSFLTRFFPMPSSSSSSPSSPSYFPLPPELSTLTSINHYLRKSYFVDPELPLSPFSKLVFSLVAYVVGYDGACDPNSLIGNTATNTTTTDQIPFFALRLVSSSFSFLTILLVFFTLHQFHTKSSLLCTLLSTFVVLFDSAHAVQTRLISSDSMTLFFIAATFYLYTRFSKCNKTKAFTKWWWSWAILTGTFLGLGISTNLQVGTFTLISIAIVSLIDLWTLLDIKTGLTLSQFIIHLVSRIFTFFFIPLTLYLSFFYIHFAVLTHSGPGDVLMSPEFQETLVGNVWAREAREVMYFDKVVVRHRLTGTVLHSSQETYPERYDDGRVSSLGQQVTCVRINNKDNDIKSDGGPEEDLNNQWEIVPVKGQVKSYVYENDIVRLRHVNTNSYLMTHDVASPYYPTNQEFTTVGDEKNFNSTLFKLQADGKYTQGKEIVRTKLGHFRLIHYLTNVAMWTHDDIKLPRWAYNQYEVNGNKERKETSNIWYFDEIVGLSNDDERNKKSSSADGKKKEMRFMKKLKELVILSITQSKLSSSASQPDSNDAESNSSLPPISWPFTLEGTYYWKYFNPSPTPFFLSFSKSQYFQIYLIGNFSGWWLELVCLAMYAGVLLADQVSRRRGNYALNEKMRDGLYNKMGFFFIGWATHYIPYFFMKNEVNGWSASNGNNSENDEGKYQVQLDDKGIVKYLPAHLLAAYLVGGLFEFIYYKMLENKRKKRELNKKKSSNESKSKEKSKNASTNVNTEISDKYTKFLSSPSPQQQPSDSNSAYLTILFIVLSSLFITFFDYVPMTYGHIGLTAKAVEERQVFNEELLKRIFEWLG